MIYKYDYSFKIILTEFFFSVRAMGHFIDFRIIYRCRGIRRGTERYLESTGFYGPFPIAYGTAF